MLLRCAISVMKAVSPGSSRARSTRAFNPYFPFFVSIPASFPCGPLKTGIIRANAILFGIAQETCGQHTIVARNQHAKPDLQIFWKCGERPLHFKPSNNLSLRWNMAFSSPRPIPRPLWTPNVTAACRKHLLFGQTLRRRREKRETGGPLSSGGRSLRFRRGHPGGWPSFLDHPIIRRLPPCRPTQTCGRACPRGSARGPPRARTGCDPCRCRHWRPGRPWCRAGG